MITLFKRRLWIKVLVPVSVCVLLVMGISLWVSLKDQNTLGRQQLTTQNKTLALAIEGGMFEALAIGDNDTVRTQFKTLHDTVKGLGVFVYDFNGLVSFSTDVDSVAKPMDRVISGPALGDINEMMASGKASSDSFQVVYQGEDYLVKNDPIPNEPRCYHCHGSSRTVLGGISVLSSMTQMQAGIQKGKTKSILISTAGLALIVFTVWLFFFLIVNKKVRQVLNAASSLRQKDFTHEYEVKEGDEINHILNRMSMVSKELKATIQEIIQGSVALGESSTTLTGIAASLNDSSTETSKKASNVSAAAEEMSTNNAAIARAMDDATDTLNSVAAAVDEMTATVGEIAKNSAESKAVIDKVVASFEVILKAVEELGVRAEDVDEVTDEISSISEQVSLLALNAKIEAARAGEAGKGFAVVAQEITELASDTSKSTQEADEKLARIKVTAKELITQVSGLTGDVKASDQAISGIATAVEEQNATTQEISRSINDASEKISSVNESVNQGAEVASEIAKDVVDVEAMSGHVQEQSSALSTDSERLSSMAEKFSQLMKQFKI
jgi:methyl-accepting chemotaxis protein